MPAPRCERTVDFMSIYPTLCDLCGIETPKHVQGRSIRSLLADPKRGISRPSPRFGCNNHAVRTEGWRYIRYADGGEELYDETKIPTSGRIWPPSHSTRSKKHSSLPISPPKTNPTPKPANPKPKKQAKKQAKQAKRNKG